MSPLLKPKALRTHTSAFPTKIGGGGVCGGDGGDGGDGDAGGAGGDGGAPGGGAGGGLSGGSGPERGDARLTRSRESDKPR